MKITDRVSYDTYIRVRVPTNPAFYNVLNSSYKIYTTQSATFLVPNIVQGTYLIASVEVTATDSAFAQTLEINKKSDLKYELVYDGTYESASTGTFTITITDELNLSASESAPYTVVVPAAPYIDPVPTDFSVVAGFDYTYDFGTGIYPGDPTEFTWSVASEELQEGSQYQFDQVAKSITTMASGSITIKASDSSFESLAGTTITVTSTIYSALA